MNVALVKKRVHSTHFTMLSVVGNCERDPRHRRKSSVIFNDMNIRQHLIAWYGTTPKDNRYCQLVGRGCSRSYTPLLLAVTVYGRTRLFNVKFIYNIVMVPRQGVCILSAGRIGLSCDILGATVATLLHVVYASCTRLPRGI